MTRFRPNFVLDCIYETKDAATTHRTAIAPEIAEGSDSVSTFLRTAARNNSTHEDTVQLADLSNAVKFYNVKREVESIHGPFPVVNRPFGVSGEVLLLSVFSFSISFYLAAINIIIIN